jgi:hypothetical protein
MPMTSQDVSRAVVTSVLLIPGYIAPPSPGMSSILYGVEDGGPKNLLILGNNV